MRFWDQLVSEFTAAVAKPLRLHVPDLHEVMEYATRLKEKLEKAPGLTVELTRNVKEQSARLEITTSMLVDPNENLHPRYCGLCASFSTKIEKITGIAPVTVYPALGMGASGDETRVFRWAKKERDFEPHLKSWIRNHAEPETVRALYPVTPSGPYDKVYLEP